MGEIPLTSLGKATTVAEVLSSWSDPVYDSHPGRKAMMDELRTKALDFATRVRNGDEVRWYEHDGLEGLALVRDGRLVDHVSLGDAPDADSRYTLVVHFANAGPTARELVSLRKLEPALRDLPLADVRSLVGDAAKWTFSRDFYPSEIDDIETRCRDAGFRTERI